MKSTLAFILPLFFTFAIMRADTLPPGIDTDNIMVGVTGMTVASKDGDLFVTEIAAGTPAQVSLKKGDILLSVDGRSLKISDFRHTLGFAINKAEGRDGQMKFSIKRNGIDKEVIIKLKPVGSYSATFSIDCKKSKRIADETGAFILANEGPRASKSMGGSINGNFDALFLLSTGEQKYIPALEKYALQVISKKPGTSVWTIGHEGIFLGEYYLATGDKRVLPALKSRCDLLAEVQTYGGWGHNIDTISPGYTTGGLLNAAGTSALITLILARECGVEVDEDAYNNALRYFFRFAGRGGVSYGNHHPELWWYSNGKNGSLAAALALLPDKKFQKAAQVLALSETDSYWGSERGHGSTFGNQAWRNIVDALVPKERHESWRRHKDKMLWYYEICRMPGGGFRAPWCFEDDTLGCEPFHQTGFIAMAYTAHLKNLRICGKPRTKYSVPHKPTAVELSLETDDFHRTDFIDNIITEEEPHEIVKVFRTEYNSDGSIKTGSSKPGINHKRKKKMPAAWYAKLMRHYSPTVREWSAHGLGFLGAKAIPEIKKALASKDGRLRVAGLDAISCTAGWSLEKTKPGITSQMIKQHFLPQILAILKDPKTPMWERRQALMALSCADQGSIKSNINLVMPNINADDWWLRVTAFEVLTNLIGDTETIRKILPALLSSYDTDTGTWSRRWGSTNFFNRAIAGNPELKEEILAGMAKSVNAANPRDGLYQQFDINNVFETLRYIDMEKHPENAKLFLPGIEKAFPKMTTQPANWIIVGARWGNIGLANAADRLGKDGRVFVASMKRLRPVLVERVKGITVNPKIKGKKKLKLVKPIEGAIDRLDAIIKAWENKFGAVEIKQ